MRSYKTHREYSQEIAKLNNEFWQAKEIGDEARCGRIARVISNLEVELRYKKKIGVITDW